MEVVALAGPYDEAIKALIKENLPSDFIVKEITSQQEFSLLTDVNYVILRVLSMDEKVIHSLPHLKLIQRWGVGYDKVAVKAAWDKSAVVAITPGMNASSVSEMAVLLMLAVYRKLISLHQNVISGVWQQPGIASESYIIDGKVVGLIGLGNIGKQVAKKVKAFGASVQYYDEYRLSERQEQELGVTYVELEELLKASDIVSLHVPLLDSTRYLIRKETLELMKPTAILINTSRGSIIKEADLYLALKDKTIMGAGLDCFEVEPASQDNSLFSLANVVTSPHMGGSTIDISVNMAKKCVENIVKISKGQPLCDRDVVKA